MVNNSKIPYQKVEEVPVWKKAHELTLETYRVLRVFPKWEQYGIISQLQRASSSIPANISEGFYRGTNKQLIQFLYNARGSLGEVVYFLRLSRDLGYLKDVKYNLLLLICEDVGKQLNGWIKSLKNINY